MRYFFSIISLFLSVVLIAACSKGNQPVTASHTPAYLPSSLTYTDVKSGAFDNRYFTYDDNDRLIEISRNNNNTKSDVKLKYDNNDRLIEADYVESISFISTFTYYADSIVERYSGVASVPVKATHILNSNKQIISTVSISGPTNYKYDSAGNMINADIYAIDQVTKEVIMHTACVFTYDNNKNPFYNVKGNYILVFNNEFFWGFTNNNMLTATYNGASSAASPYVYQFNTDGYPLNTGPLTNGIFTYVFK